MNILIIGNGGREHALAWKIRQSPKVKNIFVAPGNAGTSGLAINIPLSETKEIIAWIKANPVDLVVVGPDHYLAEGIVDQLEKLKIPVFGPTQAAAEIEWSKAFAKRFMKEEGIPTARYEIFKDINNARKYLQGQPFPVVIKASGLALGKGVIIAQDIPEAEKVLTRMMSEKIFGDAGDEVIIEEYLIGKEISVHAFCDGQSAVLFPSAQDHKRIFDGDQGPNTGGMGTIAPVPWVTDGQMKEIEDTVIMPTLRALKKCGKPFKGILFPGIMFTKTGPKVIEFNARFGDPETQSYMRLLESDLTDILFACVQGTLKEQKVKWFKKSACCIVCVSSGYPANYEEGKIVSGLETASGEGTLIFHAGTKIEGDKILTSGGRVLGVTSGGDSLKEALQKSYEAIKSVSFEGMQYRKDIGAQSL